MMQTQSTAKSRGLPHHRRLPRCSDGFRDTVTDRVNQFTFRDSARTNGKVRASKLAGSWGK